MKHLWISIACLGISFLAGAEAGNHSGAAALKENRTEQSSSARRLEDAVNACSSGRASTRGLALQPSSQPVSSRSSGGSTYYRFIPTPTPKASSPFVRENPRDNKEFPGETKFEECLKAIPVTDFFACPQVLTTCRAETVDGGKTKIRPLVVDGGDPCSSHGDFTKAACGRGLKFERFKDNDIVCGPTQSESN